MINMHSEVTNSVIAMERMSELFRFFSFISVFTSWLSRRTNGMRLRVCARRTGRIFEFSTMDNQNYYSKETPVAQEFGKNIHDAARDMLSFLLQSGCIIGDSCPYPYLKSISIAWKIHGQLRNIHFRIQ